MKLCGAICVLYIGKKALSNKHWFDRVSHCRWSSRQMNYQLSWFTFLYIWWIKRKIGFLNQLVAGVNPRCCSLIAIAVTETFNRPLDFITLDASANLPFLEIGFRPDTSLKCSFTMERGINNASANLSAWISSMGRLLPPRHIIATSDLAAKNKSRWRTWWAISWAIVKL